MQFRFVNLNLIRLINKFSIRFKILFDSLNSFQLDWIRFVSIRFYSFQLNSIRFNSIRLVSFRFVSFRFGSIRLIRFNLFFVWFARFYYFDRFVFCSIDSFLKICLICFTKKPNPHLLYTELDISSFLRNSIEYLRF